MNMIENLQRKENGIIFDKVGIPNYNQASNISLWTGKSPNYVKEATNGKIEIKKIRIVNLKHGDRVTYDTGRQYKGWQIVRKGTVGTVAGMAVEYNDDPNAEIERVKQKLVEHPYCGEVFYWVNQEATMICSDPGYYEEQKAKWASAIQLVEGQLVWLEGHVLRVHYIGDYSTMIHFLPLDPTQYASVQWGK